MAPRPSWRGFLRLSLVSIPVRFYTARASGSEVQLHQLHRECKSRIQYRKFCPVHGEVGKDDIVSGYEFQKDQYVVIEPEERDQLYLENEKAINIDAFVPPDSVDPLHFTGKAYYLLPDGAAGQEPYALLQRAMARKGVAAVARVVLYGRQEVVLVRPQDKLLSVTGLSYGNEMKQPKEFEEELTEKAVREDELRLTDTLIEATMEDQVDLSRYSDDYTERLRKLIETKVEGKEIATPPQAEAPQVINLMDALKKSVAQAQEKAKEGKSAREAAAPAARKKVAPSARQTAAPRKKRKFG